MYCAPTIVIIILTILHLIIQVRTHTREEYHISVRDYDDESRGRFIG